jgi:beta-phosphoglucomutase
MDASFQRPKAILFDHDGVLVSSESMHMEAWKQAFQQMKIPLVQEKIRLFAGRGPEALVRDYLNSLDPHRPPSDMTVQVIVAARERAFLKLSAHGVHLLEGVADGLRYLKTLGIQAGIVSNADRSSLNQTLKVYQLKPFFQAVFGRLDVPKPKPDPDAYLFAAKHLGQDVDSCWVVEDSPTGLSAALLGGFLSFAVTSNYTVEELRAPVEARPDLTPAWIGPDMISFFKLL